MNLQKKNELNLSSPDLAGILRDVLMTGAPVRFKARGFSMTPAIRDGDTITVSPCQSGELRSGDIAAFIGGPSDRLLIHRIIGTRGESFLLKGDNLQHPDGLIARSQIFGRITRIERNGRITCFGLGAERKAIALLSRFHFLSLLRGPARLLRLGWRQFAAAFLAGHIHGNGPASGAIRVTPGRGIE